MYAAAVHAGSTRIQENAAPPILNGWLESGVDQVWIDLRDPSPEDLAYLRERFTLHPLAVEECDHTGVRPKIEQFERHLYLVLHGINLNPGEDPLNTVEFKIFLWRGVLITVHDKVSFSIRAVQERLQRDPDLLARSGVDTILHRIVDAMVDRYFPVLEGMEARLEKLESEVFKDPREETLEEIMLLQRQLLTLQRLLHPQLDILGALSSGRFSEISSGDVAYFRDVYDHLERINDRAQVAREMLAGTLQCYLSQMSNRTNGVMKSLAVLATLALPATFLTSFLGMNIRFLPGRDDPATFWGITGASALLSAVILGALKRMKWL